MNRAFVKESDVEDRDTVPERTHSDLPNYITRRGLSALENAVANLRQLVEDAKSSDRLEIKSQLAGARRDLNYLEERLRRAIPVDPPTQNDHVEFGHTVSVVDENDKHYQFTLVGEDEIDIENGCISWASPIAKNLVGREIGDEIVWPKVGEALLVEITAIETG